MKKTSINKQLMFIDNKYGSILKGLAHQKIKSYYSLPITKDDLYNCFLFYLPTVLDKITGDELKKLNTIKLYAKRFYSKQCRSFTANKYKAMNLASSNDNMVADSEVKLTRVSMSELDYKDRIIYKVILENPRYPVQIVSKQLNVSRYIAKKLIMSLKINLTKIYK